MISPTVGLNLLFLVTTSSLQMFILHTNDFHSHFDMFSEKSKSCKIEDMKPDDKTTKCYGGITRMAEFIEDFRHRYRNVLLLDAGDQYQGTMWFNVFQGNVTSLFLNQLKYDAMALGNHEFDNGLEGIEPLLADGKDDWQVHILCSNIARDHRDKVPLRIEDYVIKTFPERIGHPTKVAIIGYITPEVEILSRPGIKFEDEITGIRSAISKINDSKIIIALGHSGFDRDKEIARALPDIDIVIGGLSHVLLYKGENKEGDVVEGEYPYVVRHDDGRKTLVVTAGCHGKYIGVLNVTFDFRGNLTAWSGNPALIDYGIDEDPRAQTYFDDYYPVVQLMNLVHMGTTGDFFDASNKICRIEECTLGNLFTDALVKEIHDLCKWSNVTLAIMQGGAIKESLPKGEINYADVMSSFPYNDHMVLATVDGETLLKVFEHSAEDFSIKRRHGKFLQVSGFKVKYNLGKRDGKRVVKLEAKNCYECSNHSEIDITKSYEVAMPQYLANGGDGYSMLKEAKIRFYGLVQIDIIKKYFESYDQVRAKLEDRILGTWSPETFRKKGLGTTINVLQSFTIVFFCFVSLFASCTLHFTLDLV